MLRSIKIKVLAAQVGLIIIMALFLRGVGYRVVRRFLFDAQREQLMILLQTGIDRFEYRLSDYGKRFEELATHEIITVYAQKFNAPMLHEYWAALQEEFPILSFVNERGMEDFKLVDGEISEQLRDISATPSFQNALRVPGEIVMSPIFFDEQRGPSIRFTVKNVTFFDEFIAVIMANVPLAKLTGVLETHDVGDTGFILLTDHDGTILFHSQQKYLSSPQAEYGKNMETPVSTLTITETGFGRVTLLGIDGYAVHAPLRGSSLSIIVFLPYKEFMAELKFLSIFISVTIATFVLIASLIAFNLANRIINPLIQLAAVTQKIAGGDLSLKVAVSSQDEIGMLAASFNAMIDEVKNNREELINANEHLKVTLSSIGDGVLATDAAGAVTFINPVAERFVGLTAQEALGKSVTEVFQIIEEESRQSVSIPVEGVLRENMTVQIAHPVFLLAHDGREIPIEISGAPIRGQDTRIRGVILTLRDMTGWQQAEAQRKTLEEQFHQAQKLEAVGTLAGGIAHDLNSMLGVVLGYGYMLKKRVSEGSNEQHFVQEMLTATQRAKELIMRLNTFSRPAMEHKQPLHLHKLIRESIQLLQPMLPAAITLSFSCENQDSRIEGDASSLQQVITNLCFNARDAITDRSGGITLSSKDVELPSDLAQLHQVTPGRYVQFRIEDTGEGIAVQNLDKIFTPFFTTKEVGKGSGLGLSVVYGIVKSHHGFITVESRIGKGTTFGLYFPIMNNQH